MSTNSDYESLLDGDFHSRTEHPYAGEQIPLGGRGPDLAADARHSADIANTMANRCRTCTDRANASADSAEHWAKLAEITTDTARTAADRSAIAADRAERNTHSIVLIAFGILLGLLLALLAYTAVVRVIRDITPSPVPAHVYGTSPDTPHWNVPDPTSGGAGTSRSKYPKESRP